MALNYFVNSLDTFELHVTAYWKQWNAWFDGVPLPYVVTFSSVNE